MRAGIVVDETSFEQMTMALAYFCFILAPASKISAQNPALATATRKSKTFQRKNPNFRHQVNVLLTSIRIFKLKCFPTSGTEWLEKCFAYSLLYFACTLLTTWLCEWTSCDFKIKLNANCQAWNKNLIPTISTIVSDNFWWFMGSNYALETNIM